MQAAAHVLRGLHDHTVPANVSRRVAGLVMFVETVEKNGIATVLFLVRVAHDLCMQQHTERCRLLLAWACARCTAIINMWHGIAMEYACVCLPLPSATHLHVLPSSCALRVLCACPSSHRREQRTCHSIGMWMGWSIPCNAHNKTRHRRKHDTGGSNHARCVERRRATRLSSMRSK